MNLNRFVDFIIGVPLVKILSFLPNKKPKSANPKKLLIIKLAALGDSIILIPVLRSLRNKFPNMKIDWLASTVNSGIAKHVSYADKIIVWNRNKFWSLLGVLKTLRKENYDVVFDLEQWSRGSALIAYLTGSPEVYGFSVHNQYRDSLYTKSFKKEFNDHEIYDFYNVFSLWVDLERSSQLELNETSLGIQQAKLLFEQYGINIKNGPPIVLIHPGCGDDGLPREWPLTLYAVFCHWLINKFQAKIILTSGPEESKKTHDLNKLINKKAIDLGGKLSIEAIISVIKKADMVVSGNTGVMHMAAALRKKQIAIHGPTNPIIWGPLNPHSKIVMSPCPNCPCLKLGFEYHTKDQSCMRKIDVEQVKNAFIELMKMEIK